MQITLIQGLLLALAAIIIGIDYWLEAFFIFRPLIVSTVTGIILGNVTLGLTTGALTELAFAGLTPAGGTQPPNPVLAGFMCTVIAYTTGVNAEAALGLCLPFSFLMQYVILFFYSAFSFFMAKADKCADEADSLPHLPFELYDNGYCCSGLWCDCIPVYLCRSGCDERFS